MFDISTAIISSLDVDDVLDRIMELSQDVMTAEASSLLLLDPEIGKLRFHVARGKAGESLKSATVELGQGIAGLVAQTGEPLLIEDAYADPRFNPAYDVQTGFRTRSILTSPVKTKEGVLGVVQVINKIGQDAFDSHDLHLFQLFAGLASISLENAQLFEQTRAMAEDLRRALEQERQLSIEKEKMGAYIDQQVVDEISRNRERTLALGGKIVTATVLFADLQGFTRIAETMQPQGVVSFLNEYLAAMTSIVKSEGGLLDKFLGDGLMAVFLTNEDYPEPHALRAVRAGLCMQERAKELKREWVVQRPEAAGLQARIGINTGEVVAGNIGSAVRMDYTVIGDNVNVASRIESNARGGEVYVSESTYNSVREYFDAERQEPIHVKNRAQPVQTYAVRVRS